MRWVDVLDGVDDAALHAEVTHLLHVLFVDHVETPGRTEQEDYSKVEEVILFQLFDALGVE